jgi:hypothetical protein
LFYRSLKTWPKDPCIFFKDNTFAHVSFIPDQVFFGSLQVFDEAISKLQQEDQGAHGGYFCS